MSKTDTLSRGYRTYLSENSTNSTALSTTSAAADLPTDALPMTGSDSVLRMSFFGSGDDNTTFNATLIGWRQSSGGYVPEHLASIEATLNSSITSIEGVTPNGINDIFADTLTLLSGDESAKFVDGNNLLPATLSVDLMGCAHYSIHFSINTTASANALVTSL